MRILQQCIYFPPEVGGLESHAYYLCRELVRQGDEVTMLTSRSLAGAPRAEVMEGVRVLRRWFPGRHPLGWAAHTGATFPLHLRLARDADVLHAQTFASAPPAMRARRKLGLPLVMTLHTSHFLRLARKRLWRPGLRRIIASCDWVLAASQEIRDVALELHAHPRVEALTNGVDTELFRPVTPALEPSARRRIVVPRRLFAKNGVEYLVRAMPLLARDHDVEALLIGGGPEGDRLRALARELGVADRIRFLGVRPNREMPGLLCSGEVAVFPSLMEATSVAALEAMSCGLPVAASRVGGLPEIVDGTVGALFEPGDPGALAAALGQLLARGDLAELGAHARERVVARWSLARLARRHREIYRTLLAERT